MGELVYNSGCSPDPQVGWQILREVAARYAAPAETGRSSAPILRRILLRSKKAAASMEEERARLLDLIGTFSSSLEVALRHIQEDRCDAAALNTLAALSRKFAPVYEELARAMDPDRDLARELMSVTDLLEMIGSLVRQATAEPEVFVSQIDRDGLRELIQGSGEALRKAVR